MSGQYAKLAISIGNRKTASTSRKQERRLQALLVCCCCFLLATGYSRWKQSSPRLLSLDVLTSHLLVAATASSFNLPCHPLTITLLFLTCSHHQTTPDSTFASTGRPTAEIFISCILPLIDSSISNNQPPSHQRANHSSPHPHNEVLHHPCRWRRPGNRPVAQRPPTMRCKHSASLQMRATVTDSLTAKLYQCHEGQVRHAWMRQLQRRLPLLQRRFWLRNS